jgi:hypothetical protein
MHYLVDYLKFTSGTECPEKYRLWAGISLLGHAMGKRLWLMHGRFPIHSQLYVALVGDAGSGKSTAKNDAKKLYTGLFPMQMVSASFQSHQDIIDLMCNAEQRIWERIEPDGHKKPMGYTPFYIVANELASVVSTDKKGMVEFLVDIFDESEFSTGYKGMRKEDPKRSQRVDNPCLSMLACAVPKWFMGNLKMDLFDGGLGRRLIVVYDTKTDIVDDPVMVPGGEEAQERVVEHIQALDLVSGCIRRTPAAMEWWKDWYHKHKARICFDPIISQFDQTKPVMVLKVAMILVMCQRPFNLLMEPAHLETAVKFIDELEPNIIRLTSGIGRNELAGVGATLLDYVSKRGGLCTYIDMVKTFRRYAQTPEFRQILDSYKETYEIFHVRIALADKVEREYLMLPAIFEEVVGRTWPAHPDLLKYQEFKKNGVAHS